MEHNQGNSKKAGNECKGIINLIGRKRKRENERK